MHNIQIRVVIAGAAGRMGRQLIQAIVQMNNIITLIAALEREDSTFLGIDIGELTSIGKTGIIIKSNLTSIKDDFDVFIDFTCPKSTLEHLKFCRKHQKSMVIGTTGFNESDKTAIEAASKEIAIVFDANFSIGINVMLKLLEKATKIMGNYSDIEIIEAHHRHKIDAPSGTAIKMGETIAKVMNKKLKTCAVFSREGCIGKRVPGSIGFATLRAGDIVGEHTAIFAHTGERIEISHKANSRSIFANGALQSALWLKNKKNGIFNMRDVLNLHNL